MSVQDDIMALMSQISGGGNRATTAGKEGADMYERMSDLITDKDKMYQAQRELSNLYTPDRFGSLEEQMFFDPSTGGGVADVIRKYMDDARDGVPDYASVLGDESPPVQIEEMPNPVQRLPVDVQPLGPAPVDVQPLGPAPEPPALDEDAMAAAVLEFGRSGLNKRRVDANNMSSIENGAVPLRDLLMEQQGEPMSGGDQLSLMATLFLPATALPAAAVKIGMRSAQIANFLRAGSKGEKALRQIIIERQAAAGPGRARELLERARSVGNSARSVGNSTQLPKPHQQFGSAGALRSPTDKTMGAASDFRGQFPGGMYNTGGKIRQSILNRYGRMI